MKRRIAMRQQKSDNVEVSDNGVWGRKLPDKMSWVALWILVCFALCQWGSPTDSKNQDT